VEKDEAEAVRWWEKAAEQGDAKAQYMLYILNKKMENEND
jgi:TPR repeat protein